MQQWVALGHGNPELLWRGNLLPFSLCCHGETCDSGMLASLPTYSNSLTNQLNSFSPSQSLSLGRYDYSGLWQDRQTHFGGAVLTASLNSHTQDHRLCICVGGAQNLHLSNLPIPSTCEKGENICS